MADNEFTEWIQLRADVLEYISNNSGKVDLVDINHHFQPLGHEAMLRVTELCDIGKVRHGYNGVYEVI